MQEMGRERAYSINSLGVVLQTRGASILAGAAEVERILYAPVSWWCG